MSFVSPVTHCRLSDDHHYHLVVYRLNLLSRAEHKCLDIVLMSMYVLQQAAEQLQNLQAEQPIEKLQEIIEKLEGDVRRKKEHVRGAQGTADSLAAETSEE
jgi:hypothetical protein